MNLPSLRSIEFKENTMAAFTDVQCIAALNSCLDLDKYTKLPSNVQRRISTLLCHNRVKIVCFFPTCGFGLRVYNEQIKMTFTGDEAEPNNKTDMQEVDVDGHWVRCPKELWNEDDAVIFLVMNDTGTRFLRMQEDVDDEGDELNDLSETDERGTLVQYTEQHTEPEVEVEKKAYPIWTTRRTSARKYSKPVAEVIAKRFKGVIVKS